MVERVYYLDGLMTNHGFRFGKLLLEDIDNTPIEKIHGPEILEQETCLFHQDMGSGDDYLASLHDFVHEGLYARKAAPVVRFADGEYAFYSYSLHCNGLYQQAESVEAIRDAIPMHVKALKTLTRSGKMAPLIYPGNVERQKKRFFSFFQKSKGDDRALKFIEFLSLNNLALTRDNYVPFYVVYAYLTSRLFCSAVHGKNLCVIGSECRTDVCGEWFARFSSRPNISFVDIPASYTATRWGSMKDDVLERISPDTELCLVGAGIGALMVCVDVAIEFSIPAIDAGHVLNLMNGREDKSNGPRLYTIHRDN